MGQGEGGVRSLLNSQPRRHLIWVDLREFIWIWGIEWNYLEKIYWKHIDLFIVIDRFRMVFSFSSPDAIPKPIFLYVFFDNSYQLISISSIRSPRTFLYLTMCAELWDTSTQHLRFFEWHERVEQIRNWIIIIYYSRRFDIFKIVLFTQPLYISTPGKAISI